MALRHRQRNRERSGVNKFLLVLPLLGAACSHAPIVTPVVPAIAAPAEDPFVTRLREYYEKAKPYVLAFYSEFRGTFSSTFRYPIKGLNKDFSVLVLNKDSRWTLTYNFLDEQKQTHDITEAVREISSKIGEVKSFDFVLIGYSFDGSTHTIDVGLVPRTDPLTPLFEADGGNHIDSRFLLQIVGKIVIISCSPTIKV